MICFLYADSSKTNNFIQIIRQLVTAKIYLYHWSLGHTGKNVFVCLIYQWDMSIDLRVIDLQSCCIKVQNEIKSLKKNDNLWKKIMGNLVNAV